MLADGLYQVKGDPKVWHVANGKKAHVPEPWMIEHVFGSGAWDRIIPVSAGELSAVPAMAWTGGGKLDGLYRETGDPKVSFVREGTKTHVPSTEILINTFGSSAADRVQIVPTGTLSGLRTVAWGSQPSGGGTAQNLTGGTDWRFSIGSGAGLPPWLIPAAIVGGAFLLSRGK